MKPLSKTLALVTGATRGAGKGIALELGAAGATVYVTGRSTRASRTNGWPGSVEDTADAVTAAGGRGIPVRCDHTDDAQVQALFQQIETEHGRLDLLVNNAWGAHDNALGQEPFWESSMAHWDGMFTAGVRATLLSSRLAAPIMIRQKKGLIVTTSFFDENKYTGMLFYDLAKNALNRLAYDMAQDLKPHGVASVAVSPGWMRTELVLKAFDVTLENWRSVDALHQTESTAYVGRAVAALAADVAIMAKTGLALKVGELAREYGFTDADGSQPAPFVISTP